MNRALIVVCFTTIINIMVMVFAIYYFGKNETFLDRNRKAFQQLAIINCFCMFLDTFSYALSLLGIRKYVGVQYIVRTSEYIILPLIPVIIMYMVNTKKPLTKVRRIEQVAFIINAVVLMVNLFHPIVFSINKLNFYKREAFFWLPSAITFFGFILCGYCLYYYAKISQSKDMLISLIWLLLIVIAGYSIRCFFPFINSDWVCFSFAYFIYVIFYTDIYLKVDSTTSVLNKRTFERRRVTINYPTAFIVIDINNFKAINDTYGHLCGDTILNAVGKSLIRSYGKYGRVYRIGGDEFCIILNKGVLLKETELNYKGNVHEFLNTIIEESNNNISSLSEEYEMFKDGVSQGFGIYYKGDDSIFEKEINTVDNAIKTADEKMYKVKQKYKEKCES